MFYTIQLSFAARYGFRKYVAQRYSAELHGPVRSRRPIVPGFTVVVAGRSHIGLSLREHGGAVLVQREVHGGFIRARSFSHAAMARSSSARRDWVVERPRFNPATCSTRLSVSSFNRQASVTRRPCRNIRSNKHRSRASLRLPFVASIIRSTLRPVRWFRSLSPWPPAVFPVRFPFCREFPSRAARNPCKQGSGILEYQQRALLSSVTGDGVGWRNDKGRSSLHERQHSAILSIKVAQYVAPALARSTRTG